jgi:hypothetical protein
MMSYKKLPITKEKKEKNNTRTWRRRFFAQLELSTIVDDHGDSRPVFLIRGQLSDLAHYIVEAADHFAKDNVFAWGSTSAGKSSTFMARKGKKNVVLTIQMRTSPQGDEKLRAVGVRATIGHTQQSGGDSHFQNENDSRVMMNRKTYPSESIGRVRSSSANGPP